MRAVVAAAVVAVSAWSSAPSSAACVAGQRNCVNLDLVPQVSQQIVGQETTVAPAKPPPPTNAEPYTGPTLGAVPNYRRAPEVGYRWAIN